MQETVEETKVKPQAGGSKAAHLLPNRILRLPGVLEATGLKTTSIYKLMSTGNFPRAIPLGGRMVGWRAVDIDRWCEQRFEASRAS